VRDEKQAAAIAQVRGYDALKMRVLNIEQTTGDRFAIVVQTVKGSRAGGTRLPNGIAANVFLPRSGNGEDMKPSTTDQVQGTLHEVKGDVKEKAGRVTGNPDLTKEGQAEKLTGKVQKKVGQVEKVVGQ
jgi:uncharacterized protein YjbJ (UPF0337 family)